MEVKFWPKKYVDCEICDIYEDRDAVVVQHSDTLQSNTAAYVEALGFKYDIKPTAMVWPYSAITTGLGQIAESGVMKFGIYTPSDRYVGSDGISRVLPDYAGTTYSAAGAAYYGVTQGTPKLSGEPNQGQELYDVSAGVKGYDVSGGHAGTEGNADFERQMDAVMTWYMNEFGRLPSGASDRQGKIGSPEVWIPYFLGIRNTGFNGNTSYGRSKAGGFLGDPGIDLDRVVLMRKVLTSRWENGFLNNNIPLYNQRLIDGINNAFTYKGLFNDFTHWHRAVTSGDITLLDDLFSLIHSTVGGRNAWYTGFGEAMEYAWYREMASRAVATLVGDNIHIVIDFVDYLKNDDSAGVPMRMLYDRIKQPLSVKIDLTGTVLAGQPIKSSFGKPQHLGGNEFIIDVPFNDPREGFKGVVLSSSGSADYKDFTAPSAEISVSGGNTIVSCNSLCRVVLFNGNLTDNPVIVGRSNELKDQHVIPGLGNMIGLISESGETVLIEQ